jgi:hypothetical protein
MQIEYGMGCVPERPEKLKIITRIIAQDLIAKMNNGRPSYYEREDNIEGQRKQLLMATKLSDFVVKQPAHLQDVFLDLCKPIAQISNLLLEFCNC